MATKKVTKKKQLAKGPKKLKKDFRVSEYEWNKISIRAREFAGGNISRWLVFAALNCNGKYLEPR